MDLILRYADALFLREIREKGYRAYVTNVLKGAFNVEGLAWVEMAYPQTTKPEKSADDILSGLIKRGGLVAKHGFT